LIETFLEMNGFRLATANSYDIAACILSATKPDLLVSSMILRGGDGESLARLADSLSIPVLLITGHPDAAARLADSSYPWMMKPLKLAALKVKIDELLAKQCEESALG
jgi:DNA-binding NtrC family response regulator